jgi:hypothetical protein
VNCPDMAAPRRFSHHATSHASAMMPQRIRTYGVPLKAWTL